MKREAAQASPKLTIGEFATVTHLSVRTRRYHQGGLLEPAWIDGSTGYRYHTPEQIPTAQVIHRLRNSTSRWPTSNPSSPQTIRGTEPR